MLFIKYISRQIRRTIKHQIHYHVTLSHNQYIPCIFHMYLQRHI